MYQCRDKGRQITRAGLRYDDPACRCNGNFHFFVSRLKLYVLCDYHYDQLKDRRRFRSRNFREYEVNREEFKVAMIINQ